MRHVNGVFTQCINRLKGRFKSILVQKESHLLELARYIVLNPVRAKMVRSTKDWKWSSYRATAGQVEAPGFLTTDWLLAQFGKSRSAATRAHRAFVKQGRGADVSEDAVSGVLMGSRAFIDEMRPLLTDVAENREYKRDEGLAARPALDELFHDVADKTTRNQRIHHAMRIHEYTLKELSEHLHLHYSTISVIAKQVEAGLQGQK